MQRGQVDLRTCKPGDILVSVHGAVLVYVGAAQEEDLNFPHVAKFLSHPDRPILVGEYATRTDDGYMWASSRTKGDHDIVIIIPKELLQIGGILGVTE